MKKSSVRVLVVDDYELWRRYLSKRLGSELGLEIIGEVSDGLDAVRRAQELLPDLVVLDVGLPSLNGIEAARQIREISPSSKIIFVSEDRSPDVVEEALSAGAGGYVVKSYAGEELLPAVEAILQGKLFLSVGVMADRGSRASTNDHPEGIRHSHEVEFYVDDRSLVDGYARFIGSSLKSGDAVIVVVTESHRTHLFPKLEADGVDVAEAIEQGHCISLDAADTLSKLTVNDMPDPVRCTQIVADLIMRAANAVQETNGRVAVCGETSPVLLSKGNAEGAIKLEHVWDEITRSYGVRTLCGYLSNAFPNHGVQSIFQRICAEHSAVHGWGPRR